MTWKVSLRVSVELRVMGIEDLCARERLGGFQRLVGNNNNGLTVLSGAVRPWNRGQRLGEIGE
jgi:hypothetical protein